MVPGSDYEHTLSTVWQGSFGKLTENSTRLLNVLSFLNPDCIPEDILSQGAEGLGEEFSSLSDGMELFMHSRAWTLQIILFSLLTIIFIQLWRRFRGATASFA